MDDGYCCCGHDVESCWNYWHLSPLDVADVFVESEAWLNTKSFYR